MIDNGVQAFFNWFDDEVWYPLGRHVGSTTYPGMMLTATAIHKFLILIGSKMEPIRIKNNRCRVWY